MNYNQWRDEVHKIVQSKIHSPFSDMVNMTSMSFKEFFKFNKSNLIIGSTDENKIYARFDKLSEIFKDSIYETAIGLGDDIDEAISDLLLQIGKQLIRQSGSVPFINEKICAEFESLID